MRVYDYANPDSAEVFFRCNNQQINSLAWVNNKSGDFITSSRKVGALKIWNVAQKDSKTIIKVGTSGIKHFVPLVSNPNLYVISFEKGSVGIYDIEKRKFEFLTEEAHSETIFDIQFCPWNKDLIATCSYYSTVKVWNASNMKLISNIPATKLLQAKLDPTDKVIFFALAWSPTPDDKSLIAID